LEHIIVRFQFLDVGLLKRDENVECLSIAKCKRGGFRDSAEDVPVPCLEHRVEAIRCMSFNLLPVDVLQRRYNVGQILTQVARNSHYWGEAVHARTLNPLLQAEISESIKLKGYSTLLNHRYLY
jgi:hypothetical protein